MRIGTNTLANPSPAIDERGQFNQFIVSNTEESANERSRHLEFTASADSSPRVDCSQGSNVDGTEAHCRRMNDRNLLHDTPPGD
jgi:hypothetical protein